MQKEERLPPNSFRVQRGSTNDAHLVASLGHGQVIPSPWTQSTLLLIQISSSSRSVGNHPSMHKLVKAFHKKLASNDGTTASPGPASILSTNYVPQNSGAPSLEQDIYRHRKQRGVNLGEYLGRMYRSCQLNAALLLCRVLVRARTVDNSCSVPFRPSSRAK